MNVQEASCTADTVPQDAFRHMRQCRVPMLLIGLVLSASAVLVLTLFICPAAVQIFAWLYGPFFLLLPLLLERLVNPLPWMRRDYIVQLLFCAGLSPFVTWCLRSGSGHPYIENCTLAFAIAAIAFLICLKLYFSEIIYAFGLNIGKRVLLAYERCITYLVVVPLLAEGMKWCLLPKNEKLLRSSPIYEMFAVKDRIFAVLHFGGVFLALCFGAALAFCLLARIDNKLLGAACCSARNNLEK